MKKLNSKNIDWKYLVGAVLFFLLFILFLPEIYHSNDMVCWHGWAHVILNKGIGNVYTEPWVNYHPIFLYCLDLFGYINGSFENILTYRIYIKIFPLIFDFIGAFSLFLIFQKSSKNKWLPFLILLNLPYVYNSIFWCQVDSIHTTFTLLALIFALRENTVFAFCFFLLALNTKLQAIIFFPILGLILLPVFRRKPKSILPAFILAGLLQILILLPFILEGQLGNLRNVVFGAVGKFPVVSLRAFNIWEILLAGQDLRALADTTLWKGLDYHAWGYIMFFPASTIVLFPLAIRCFQLFLSNKAATLNENCHLQFDENFAELVFLSATLVTLIFFFFNTQMHERYSHPVLIFSFFYGVFRKNYLICFFCSVAVFLNMEGALKAFELNNYGTLIFEEWFVATIFALPIIIGTIRLYRAYELRSNCKEILSYFKHGIGAFKR